MPQLKVGHLRAQPMLPDHANAPLIALATRLSASNCGATATERSELNQLVYDAFDVTPTERTLMDDWATAHPLPEPRRRAVSTDTL